MTTRNPASVPFVILLFLSSSSARLTITGNKTANMWREAGRMTGLLLHDCMQLDSIGPQKQFLLILQRCLKRSSLAALDRSLDRDVIELVDGIELVRYRQEDDTTANQSSRSSRTAPKLDRSSTDWKSGILQRIAHVFNTHVLKIRLNDRQGSSTEARRRHHRNQMMPLMMFGVMSVGLIMIPMGFQFLAVLGGKALLLAKMALLLTSIQGLKKIATSNVNYGLYATPNPGGQCKDSTCDLEFLEQEPYTPEDDDSNVFFSLDIDETPQSNVINDDYALGFSGHYDDRQWPQHQLQNHDANSPYYYETADQQADLVHPLHPRIDAFGNKYDE